MNAYQGPTGSKLPQSKLDESDVRLIRQIHSEKQAEIKKLNEGCSAKALAEKFGVHCRTIEKVLNYSTWRHVY
jgi:hypothetical protein